MSTLGKKHLGLQMDINGKEGILVLSFNSLPFTYIPRSPRIQVCLFSPPQRRRDKIAPLKTDFHLVPINRLTLFYLLNGYK